VVLAVALGSSGLRESIVDLIAAAAARMAESLNLSLFVEG